MDTRGRAYYNLLRVSWEEDPSLEVESWQVENYRNLSTEQLLLRLKALDLPLDEVHFKGYVDHSESPEELTEMLAGEEEGLEHFDEIYLLVFELWRRLCPEKESLSIFCDELDHLMGLYDKDELENPERLLNALTELENVLDEHADQGEDPKRLFQEISLYSAHDLENFIYDFISEKIDQDDRLEASEILEGFSDYIAKPDWFEFLRLRLLASVDEEEAEAMLARFLEQQYQNPDLELLLEIARFLVNRGSVNYFVAVAKKSVTLLETEADFQELLAITYEFYRLLDREDEMEKLSEMLKVRLRIPLDQEIRSDDPLVRDFTRLIEDFDRSEA